jgi:hypothetical protein
MGVERGGAGGGFDARVERGDGSPVGRRLGGARAAGSPRGPGRSSSTLRAPPAPGAGTVTSRAGCGGTAGCQHPGSDGTRWLTRRRHRRRLRARRGDAARGAAPLCSSELQHLGAAAVSPSLRYASRIRMKISAATCRRSADS